LFLVVLGDKTGKTESESKENHKNKMSRKPKTKLRKFVMNRALTKKNVKNQNCGGCFGFTSEQLISTANLAQLYSYWLNWLAGRS
jgi:hypothetical protein